MKKLKVLLFVGITLYVLLFAVHTNAQNLASKFQIGITPVEWTLNIDWEHQIELKSGIWGSYCFGKRQKIMANLGLNYNFYNLIWYILSNDHPLERANIKSFSINPGVYYNCNRNLNSRIRNYVGINFHFENKVYENMYIKLGILPTYMLERRLKNNLNVRFIFSYGLLLINEQNDYGIGVLTTNNRVGNQVNVGFGLGYRF